MLDPKFKQAADIVNALTDKTIQIEAKDEKQAVAKLNKAMKNPEGYGFKVLKSKGYYGKYKVVKSFKNRSTGDECLEFNLREKQEGFYEVGEDSGGYRGQD